MTSQSLTSLTNENQPRLNVVWRVGIVFTLATLIWLLIGAIAHSAFGADYDRTAHVLRAVLASLLAIPLVVGARRWLDRRPWDGLGLTSLRTGWRPLFIGMLCWTIPAAVGILACLLLGWTTITPLVSAGEILALTAGLFVLVFIYEALPEELIFRGYFYRNLADVLPLWVAIVAQAALFTLWGLLNGGENSLERSALFFSFAIVVGIFRAVTGSVWAAIGFHLAFQTVAQLLGTVGGQFSVSSPQTLMMVAFGILPFAFSIYILRTFYKNRPDWTAREPDLPSASSGESGKVSA